MNLKSLDKIKKNCPVNMYTGIPKSLKKPFFVGYDF